MKWSIGHVLIGNLGMEVSRAWEEGRRHLGRSHAPLPFDDEEEPMPLSNRSGSHCCGCRE